MKCDMGLLEDYVEGFLDEQERQVIEQHLKYCHSCKQEYVQLVEEQKALKAQLSAPLMVESQANRIMQQLQGNTKRKKSWQTLQVAFICTAVFLLSFAIYYLNKTPNEMAQVTDEPIEVIVTTDEQQLVEIVAAEPEEEPMLKVSIDKVIENGEKTEIQFRIKLNDALQKQQSAIYKQLRSSYQYHDVDYAQVDYRDDLFFRRIEPSVRFAIRDEQGRLITAATKVGEETPIIDVWNMSGVNTEVLGEWVYTTTVPTYTNPATFEVLYMQAKILHLFEAPMQQATVESFKFNGLTYRVDTLELKQNKLHVTLSMPERQSNPMPSWMLVFDNHLYDAAKGSSYYNGERTVIVAVFEGFSKVPNDFKIVPDTTLIEQDLEQSIVLDLR